MIPHLHYIDARTVKIVLFFHEKNKKSL